jgi:SNF2 family DNA or RNA helicase
VLVFSKSTRILDMLEREFQVLRYPTRRLDGSTPVHERLALVDRFQRGENEVRYH